jgi:hypothetical protein
LAGLCTGAAISCCTAVVLVLVLILIWAPATAIIDIANRPSTIACV